MTGLLSPKSSNWGGFSSIWGGKFVKMGEIFVEMGGILFFCKSEHFCFCIFRLYKYMFVYIFIYSFFSHFYFPGSGQAVVTGVVPFPPRFLPSIFIAHRVQKSHCSSIFHRVLLTHALALSASQLVRREKSLRIIRVCTRGDSNSRNGSIPGGIT